MDSEPNDSVCLKQTSGKVIECDVCLQWRRQPFECFICGETQSSREKALAHLLQEHSVVIAEVEKISNLKQYLGYYGRRYKLLSPQEGKEGALLKFCLLLKPKQRNDDSDTSHKSSNTDNSANILKTSTPHSVHQSDMFFVLGLMADDGEVRQRVNEELLQQVLECKKVERKSNFQRKCFFCKDGDVITNTKDYFDHLYGRHALNLGHPDNIVHVSSMLSFLEGIISTRTCPYCRKQFDDWTKFKAHLRKKRHYKLDPKDERFDEFYIKTFTTPGVPWQEMDGEEAISGSGSKSKHQQSVHNKQSSRKKGVDPVVKPSKPRNPVGDGLSSSILKTSSSTTLKPLMATTSNGGIDEPLQPTPSSTTAQTAQPQTSMDTKQTSAPEKGLDKRQHQNASTASKPETTTATASEVEGSWRRRESSTATSAGTRRQRTTSERGHRRKDEADDIDNSVPRPSSATSNPSKNKDNDSVYVPPHIRSSTATAITTITTSPIKPTAISHQSSHSNKHTRGKHHTASGRKGRRQKETLLEGPEWEDFHKRQERVSDSDWSSWKESEPLPTQCLMCNATQSSPDEVLKHMTQTHGIDLLTEMKRFHLSFYDRIKFTNFLRHRQHQQRVFDETNEGSLSTESVRACLEESHLWKNDSFLLPSGEDHILMCLDMSDDEDN
eukprot:m.95148 g.95148  ORF g.95148 m.95148 type:complete len:667 (+) comp12425_c0_seq2:24-2024(+)